VRYALFIFFGLCLCGIFFSFSRGKLRNAGSEAERPKLEE
jgi:hypothetical protein